MGGQGGSHHHSYPRLSSPGGEVRASPHAFPSSSSSCCCSCHWRCPSFCSPSSELESEVHTTGSGGVDADDGVDGAPTRERGGVIGGEARFCDAGDDGTPSRARDALPLQGEPSISADAASRNASAYTEEEISRWRQRRTYLDLLRSYRDGGSSGRLALIEEAKDAIRRYTPGKWIERVGGTTPSKYRVPSTTTLLLVGPRGSGKSALVNRISRFLEDDTFLPDRAQVSHNLYTTEGTYFLKEYMIPRDSTSFCVYDTRGLSEVASENLDILKRWMSEGVRHEEMVLRDSDLRTVKSKIKAMAHDMLCSHFVRRRVNFVIFVVNGISVLKAINSLRTNYTDMLLETFNYPFMSFKDNKPVVVVTHGDLLSFQERALVCTHLGELLGVPANKQIFDVPDLNCPTAKLAMVDLLRYSLEQSDRNLPLASQYVLEVTKLQKWMVEPFQDFETCILILDLVIIIVCACMFLTTSFGKLVN
uniref:Urease accessory protein UreG n=1 Tax=Anthurium amnicola TaxID=1678845 RepID=A0A1D1Z9N4_9ARAE